MYPIKNRRIDDLDANFAYQYTQFSKEQLHQLFTHLGLPTTVILPRRQYRFTKEEILVVCLAKLATGEPWNRLIPLNFGGGILRWSDALELFINDISVQFYNKISGTSLQR